MKKNFIAAAVLLLATVGAFATAKNTVLDLVFIQTPTACVQVQSTKCPFIGPNECVQPIFDLSGASLGNAQIYKTQLSATLCDEPYQRVQTQSVADS